MMTRASSAVPSAPGVPSRRAAHALVAMVVALVSFVAVTSTDSNPVAAARDWHVAPWGNDASDGTWANPHRTISHAVKAARSGDKVVIAGGTYSESVQVYNKAVHIESRPGQRAVLDGNNRLAWGIYLNRAHGSSLTNITVRNYATPASKMAAIRVYSNNVEVSGVHATENHRIGLSAIGSNITVSDGRFVRNGHLGVHGHELWNFRIERSAVRSNNTRGYDPFHSAGGMKFTNSLGIAVIDNDVSHNAGPGIWTDLYTVYVTIGKNLVQSNQRAGIEIELSSFVNVVSNVALDNGEAGIWILESQQVSVYHNASFGNPNAIEVEEGPRRNVDRVRIRNNTMGAAAPGSRALLDVNDWTEQRSAAQMRVTVDRNAYWVGPDSATNNISRWGVWPNYPAFSTTLSSHRQVTGAGPDATFSTANDNPFARSVGSFDYRVPSSMDVVGELPGATAKMIGVAPTADLRVGPVAPVVRRG